VLASDRRELALVSEQLENRSAQAGTVTIIVAYLLDPQRGCKVR
jgi:hypothetical protein